MKKPVARSTAQQLARFVLWLQNPRFFHEEIEKHEYVRYREHYRERYEFYKSQPLLGGFTECQEEAFTDVLHMFINDREE